VEGRCEYECSCADMRAERVLIDRAQRILARRSNVSERNEKSRDVANFELTPREECSLNGELFSDFCPIIQSRLSPPV